MLDLATMANVTLLLIFVALTAVAAQTFQYSHGWTNGKRDGRRREDLGIEKILSPCQLHKLKYLLEGKPFNERLLTLCDYSDDDVDPQKRYKHDRSQDGILQDAFL